ncbi:hypothetical protein SSYM_0511, partial [Serratia symbiotica str. Tucson]
MELLSVSGMEHVLSRDAKAFLTKQLTLMA